MSAIGKFNLRTEHVEVNHAIVGYDKETEMLISELKVPRFLESLAFKIVGVSPEDPDGTLTYRLEPWQQNIFRYILGLDAQSGADYFLEPTHDRFYLSSTLKAEAFAKFSELIRNSESKNFATRRITESELTVPSLSVLACANEKVIKTSDLKERVFRLLTNHDRGKSSSGALWSYLSEQTVRNIICNRTKSNSFLKHGLADYIPEQHGLSITSKGRQLVQSLKVQ